MTDNNSQSDEYSDDNSVKSANSFVANVEEDEENLSRPSSNLNNYPILPPIKPSTKENNSQQQYFIKHLQEKYQADKQDTLEIGNEAKLDDAYLKMKRLDKALEEAFEKEKQVKVETMSLMKKLRSEMQSMTSILPDDTNELSHTQSNLKRFLALDDEILKLDGGYLEYDNSNTPESIFKTQINDPLDDSNSVHKSDKVSSNSNTKSSSLNKNKKKSSISSNSTINSKDKSKQTKPPEKDFIKRNIQLAKEAGGAWALTDDEKQRLKQLLDEDEQVNVVALPGSHINGYIPSINESQRLKEIDDLLEKEYYNPLLNHQLRRNNHNDVDYTTMQQITNEENEQIDNHFGERVLKETRLQREHMQRLKKIDEKLEILHQPMTEEKIEAILSEEQLNELLGQCAVDDMKSRYSLLNRDREDYQEIDFNELSNYALTHYVGNTQGPLITDEIIQLLINEAQQEGITMRQFHDDDVEDGGGGEENMHSSQQQQQQHTASLSFAPAIDRPSSTTSTASHIDIYNRNLS
ncbi:unnamed protein product [Adineta steineri]|uniref:Fibrous sheath-interacting protein 1 n=1 Tax=Adineta steineri TaxID=433720 RepID=A0A813VGP4_9BILA|nr:unnamed protein product [Adineta steineri]